MPAIFISYRRSDSQDVTGRVYDRLIARFAKNQIFKDVDSIPLGVSFPMHIQQVLGKASATLVMIGPSWLTATDEQGRRRLDDPNDLVRVEIESALRARMPVIPVLVSNARMPQADELPASLRKLLSRNGIAVRPDPDFNNDIERLFAGIEYLERLTNTKPAPGSAKPKLAPATFPAVCNADDQGASSVQSSKGIVAGKKATLAKESSRLSAAGQADSPAHGRGWRVLVLAMIVAASIAALVTYRELGLWPRISDLVAKANNIGVSQDADTRLRDAGPNLAAKANNIAVPLASYVNKPSGEVIENSIGMKLAYIPPGTFTMGSPKSEQQQYKKEGGGGDDWAEQELEHEVTISTGFYMGVQTVTQQEYEKVMDTNSSWFSAAGGGKKSVAALDTRRFPVETVSWKDAKEFCRKLGAKEGKTYRLPTEAEWEYACRAGTKSAFYFGDTISPDQANYDGRDVFGAGNKGVYRARTMEVGSFLANTFGLHDMHGNVYQWCEDGYDKNYYNNSPITNPLNRNSDTHRVVRGGSWYYRPGYCRSAYRGSVSPGYADNNIGFRVVLSSP